MSTEYDGDGLEPDGQGGFRCNIEVTVKRDLHSSAIGPDRLLLKKGDRIVITRIYCHNGPYAYKGGYKGGGCVPRSWLVECGALEPLTESDCQMVARLKARGEL